MNRRKRYSVVAINPELHAKAKKFCKYNGLTMGGLVSELLTDYLVRNERNNGRLEGHGGNKW